MYANFATFYTKLYNLIIERKLIEVIQEFNAWEIKRRMNTKIAFNLNCTNDLYEG